MKNTTHFLALAIPFWLFGCVANAPPFPPVIVSDIKDDAARDTGPASVDAAWPWDGPVAPTGPGLDAPVEANPLWPSGSQRTFTLDLSGYVTNASRPTTPLIAPHQTALVFPLDLRRPTKVVKVPSPADLLLVQGKAPCNETLDQEFVEGSLGRSVTAAASFRGDASSLERIEVEMPYETTPFDGYRRGPGAFCFGYRSTDGQWHWQMARRTPVRDDLRKVGIGKIELRAVGVDAIAIVFHDTSHVSRVTVSVPEMPTAARPSCQVLCEARQSYARRCGQSGAVKETMSECLARFVSEETCSAGAAAGWASARCDLGKCHEFCGARQRHIELCGNRSLINETLEGCLAVSTSPDRCPDDPSRGGWLDPVCAPVSPKVVTVGCTTVGLATRPACADATAWAADASTVCQESGLAARTVTLGRACGGGRYETATASCCPTGPGPTPVRFCEEELLKESCSDGALERNAVALCATKAWKVETITEGPSCGAGYVGGKVECCGTEPPRVQRFCFEESLGGGATVCEQAQTWKSRAEQACARSGQHLLGAKLYDACDGGGFRRVQVSCCPAPSKPLLEACPTETLTASGCLEPGEIVSRTASACRQSGGRSEGGPPPADACKPNGTTMLPYVCCRSRDDL